MNWASGAVAVHLPGLIQHLFDRHAVAGPGLRERVQAWWEGYYLDQPELPADEPEPVQERHASAPPPGQSRFVDLWSADRIRIAESIWGNGFSFPGGADHVINLVKPFGLGKEKSMLDIGCGLGGATRAIAKHFDTWTMGLEASKNLAEAGMKVSEQSGLGRRAPIEWFDPDSVSLQQSKFDCAFCRQVLAPLSDKRRMLGEIQKGLKPGGQLLITDFMLAAPSASGAAVKTWLGAEDHPPHPWTAAEYQQALKRLKIDVRVTEDMTHEFRSLVMEGWGRLAQMLAPKVFTKEQGQQLMRELELWCLRVGALDSGELKVGRIFAIKRA